MNCKKFRDLIATDYIDMQLDAGLLRKIREHLKECAGCREFEHALRGAAVEPFKTAKKLSPPDFIWERIKEEILAEETESENIFAVMAGYVRAFLNSRRSVFALGTALAAFIAVAVVLDISLTERLRINRYFQEQKEFFSSLGGNTESYTSTNQVNLGTKIEEYFL